MVIDYSKWDNLELSDDSDVEVHPNVDKRSFIRWKQRDIHEKRHVRAQEKSFLESEQVMNEKLLSRIENLLTAMKMHSPQSPDESPEEFVLNQLVEQSSPEDDMRAPDAPKDAPTYGEMITKLVDTVAAETPKNTSSRWNSFVVELQNHYAQLETATKQSKEKLEKMKVEDSKKITSEGLRTGFDSTHVSKATPELHAPAPDTTTKKKKAGQVELLNPKAISNTGSIGDVVSSGAEADVDEEMGDEDDEDDIKATEIGKGFAKIKVGDYRGCAEYISKNPTVLAERETDGLLVEAFNSQLAGQPEHARQCVHQALLLQYCRQLGRDGVALFFKRITTPNHQAQKVFQDDVNQTYDRIRTRAKEILAQREAEPEGVEQIQLHAVDPNTQITISIPPKDSNDAEIQESRAIFDSFPPGLQRALASANLDEVNKVLGKMSVSEAEEVVEKLSRGGMLNLEEQIIDATTEEGQAQLAEIEKTEENAKTRGVVSTPATITEETGES